MPKKEYELEIVTEEVRRMQKHWFAAAQAAHDDWADMKYNKGTSLGDYPSKKDFDAYRRKVFNFHKYFLYRSKICGRIADFMDGEAEELNFKGIKEDSALKKAGKIIYENFINPDALRNAGGRN